MAWLEAVKPMITTDFGGKIEQRALFLKRDCLKKS